MLLAMEGFDIYGRRHDVGGVNYCNFPMDSRWSTRSTAYGYVHPTEGRRGGPCLALFENSGGLTLYYVKLDLGTSYSTLILGMAYYATYLASATPALPILLFEDVSGNVQFVIHRTAADGLEVRASSGGALLGASANNVVKQNVYQYLEIKAICHATTGSVVIKIDGAEVLNAANINTQNAGAGSFEKLHFRSYNTNIEGPTYIDDLYILDDTGGAHYDAINDLGSGYNTQYLESALVGDQDCWTVTPDPMIVTIRCVELMLFCYNPGGGTAKGKPFVRIGGTIYYGTEFTLSPGTCDKRNYIWYTNPATGLAWVNADVGTAEFGCETTVLTTP